MGRELAEAIRELTEEEFELLFGRWEPLEPVQVAELFAARPARWWIAGGRAARAGAEPRQHHDTDVVLLAGDLDGFREAHADWHFWQASGGTLRPLLPGVAAGPDCGQLWMRRSAGQPWQLDLLLDHRSGAEWVYKRDPDIRLPWERALHQVGGLPYLRPEVALLHKAKQDRPRDRDDLRAARLDPVGRAWLIETLARLGHRTWADLARQTA